jgi:hypothetical protein
VTVIPSSPAVSGTTTPDAQALETRVRGEFLEMPDLRLAPAQAARLWAVDREACERVLSQLVASGFLWQTRAGLFLRATVS